MQQAAPPCISLGWPAAHTLHGHLVLGPAKLLLLILSTGSHHQGLLSCCRMRGGPGRSRKQDRTLAGVGVFHPPALHMQNWLCLLQPHLDRRSPCTRSSAHFGGVLISLAGQLRGCMSVPSICICSIFCRRSCTEGMLFFKAPAACLCYKSCSDSMPGISRAACFAVETLALEGIDACFQPAAALRPGAPAPAVWHRTQPVPCSARRCGSRRNTQGWRAVESPAVAIQGRWAICLQMRSAQS